MGGEEQREGSWPGRCGLSVETQMGKDSGKGRVQQRRYPADLSSLSV